MPFIEYFQPLREFLQIENQRLRLEHETREKLENYNVAATEQCTKLQLAEWAFITDINNKEKEAARAKAIVDNARFLKDQYNLHFKGLKPENFEDENIKRQILYIYNLGINALNESRLSEWSRLKSSMESIYTNTAFCNYFKQDCNLETEALTLDPGK